MYSSPPAHEQDALRARGFWLYFRGFVVTTLCGTVLWALCSLLLDELYRTYYDIDARTRASAIFLGTLILGVIPGLLIGACQYLVLFWRTSAARRWVTASVVGWGIGALFIAMLPALRERWHVILDGYWGPLVFALVYFGTGVLVGLWQSLGLRKLGLSSWVWPLLSATGFMLAVGLGLALFFTFLLPDTPF